MERKEVTSSNIASVGYDATTQTLEVEFTSGKVYQYANVPAKTHSELMSADSVGSFFAANIKKRFAGALVGDNDGTE